MIQDTLQQVREQIIDGGPLYTETDFSHFIVEPWNALSSLLVMIPSIYFLSKVWHQKEQYKFLIYAIVLVMAGSVGSTLFHGLRSSQLFLLMDIIPIVLLTISLSVYFWLKLIKWYYMLLILIPLFASRFFFFGNVPEHTAINISYAISGITVLLPWIILLFKQNFKYWPKLLIIIVSFGLALYFRSVDGQSPEWLTMGTHFLWHVFSAIGVWFLIEYLYYYRKDELKSQ